MIKIAQLKQQKPNLQKKKKTIEEEIPKLEKDQKYYYKPNFYIFI